MLIHELISSLDIHLLAVGQADAGAEWNYRNVNNFYNRLLFCLDGEAVVHHQGREYRLQRGDLHMIPCYTPADYVCRSSFSHYYATFTSRAFGGVDICSFQEYDCQRKARDEDLIFFERLIALNPFSELPVRDPFLVRYRQYHEERSRTYHEKPPRLHLENMSYVSLLLAPFLFAGPKQHERWNSPRLLTFLSYVEEHLNQPISMQEVAKQLGVAPNYLSDWLAKNFRIRPVDYVNRRRVEEAQHQLIATAKSIKEIGHDVGFSSVSYFSRVFRKQTGMTASRYRSLYE